MKSLEPLGIGFRNQAVGFRCERSRDLSVVLQLLEGAGDLVGYK